MNLIIHCLCLLGMMAVASHSVSAGLTDCTVCRYDSYQNKVCSEEVQWVILGKVLAVNKLKTRYTVQIQKFYKPTSSSSESGINAIIESLYPKAIPDFILKLLPDVQIHTVEDSEFIYSCQVKLDKKSVYVLSGSITKNGKWYMDICNNVNFLPTTKFKLKNFETLFPSFMDNCKCQVEVVSWDENGPLPANSAIYKATKNKSNCLDSFQGMECANHHGYCTKQKDGNCGWDQTLELNPVCKLRGWSYGGEASRG